MKILVADDDAQIRAMLKAVLSRDGHAVLEAADGDTVLKLAAAYDIDVVLVDMVMPRREGLETILDLRRTHPRVKIIAMSGGARVGAADPLVQAQECGVAGVMAKPFEPEALLAMIRQAAAIT